MLIDIEKRFIAIHREGLKGCFTVLAERGDRANNPPGKERKLIVHHMSIVDTDTTRKIINEGAPFLGSGDRHLLKMCTINSTRFHFH